eukprot:6591147-Pyramimonas_sp.AAC.1
MGRDRRMGTTGAEDNKQAEDVEDGRWERGYALGDNRRHNEERRQRRREDLSWEWGRGSRRDGPGGMLRQKEG